MASFSVSVQNVSKKYRLFNSPKERLLEALHPFKKKYHREFWALKNINLDIQNGTTVGIIGRNGSGKSTLLQVICSVLRPTSGTVETTGRISALLALGAGFNPEFSGRDNVLLNGALQGFSKAEMKKRMPAIESFADIGEFMDQPMKIYSSGMSLRLAFAAAINVDPDILVIDETLAVGDAKFQHKCFQKFLEFQKAGKTIILVTHDVNSVIKHCDYAILLEEGRVVKEGTPKTVANYYIDLLFTGKISVPAPSLLESGFNGFNIIHCKDKYYGLAQSLGEVDFISPSVERDLEKYIEEGRCVIGASLEQTKTLIDELVFGSSVCKDERVDETLSMATEKAILDTFLQETPVSDNCVNRNSYNKNEYRQGYHEAEIIDYLVVCGDKVDPTTVCSGEVVDIYVKTRFNKDVASPLFGFSIKTVDGVLIYAFNSFFTGFFVLPAKKSDIIVTKFSVKMKLAPGDIFIDLGIDQSRDGTDRKFIGRECAYDSLDRRCSIIHLFIQETNWFHGLADFEASCQEVVRNWTAVGNHIKFSS